MHDFTPWAETCTEAWPSVEPFVENEDDDEYEADHAKSSSLPIANSPLEPAWDLCEMLGGANRTGPREDCFRVVHASLPVCLCLEPERNPGGGSDSRNVFNISQTAGPGPGCHENQILAVYDAAPGVFARVALAIDSSRGRAKA